VVVSNQVSIPAVTNIIACNSAKYSIDTHASNQISIPNCSTIHAQVVAANLEGGAMFAGPNVKPIGGNIMAHATTTRLCKWSSTPCRYANMQLSREQKNRGCSNCNLLVQVVLSAPGSPACHHAGMRCYS
jgi:hypothetical protein